MDDGRLHFGYNHLGSTLTTVSAEVRLPAGPVVARIEFTPTGAFAGDVELYYGDVPVGQGHIARTTLVTFGVRGFTVGYQNGTPVSPRCPGRSEFTPGALGNVVIETDERVRRGVPGGRSRDAFLGNLVRKVTAGGTLRSPAARGSHCARRPGPAPGL